MPEFFWRALAVLLVLSFLTGPLGSLAVWKKMAFFGDTLSHAALLGVALALWVNINPHFGVFAVSIILALVISLAQQQKTLAADTILGIVAHSSLALGVIVASLIQNLRINLDGFLFGDILAVGQSDVLWLLVFELMILPVFIYFWPTLVLASVSRDLAKVEGAPVAVAEHVLTLSFALLVAFAINLVGMLLLTALLVIPAASARRLATTPANMAFYAILTSSISGVFGLLGSFYWDTPTGPSIVAAAISLFLIISLLVQKWR